MEFSCNRITMERRDGYTSRSSPITRCFRITISGWMTRNNRNMADVLK